MNSDLWKNRSEKMKCESCMAYAPKDGKLGRCRRHSPTTNGYPVVFGESDWCLDHKLDETFSIISTCNVKDDPGPDESCVSLHPCRGCDSEYDFRGCQSCEYSEYVVE